MTEKVLRPVCDLLDHGNCEPFKAGVHAIVLTMTGLCAAYNAAAWLKRRQRHLAVNAIVYGAAVWLERCHVMHHLAACKEKPLPMGPPVEAPPQLVSAA
jgi:hypothetical protein